MVELKTLKDLEYAQEEAPGELKFKVDTKRLRQEAIKWIQKLQLIDKIRTKDMELIDEAPEEHLYDHPELKFSISQRRI